ncbi:MAG: kynureninase [Acidimicrobiia bacterium]|nr:kynureninase [Acidimicrobiia bacterium]
MRITIDDVAVLDSRDPLSSYRSRFHLPDGHVYLDGNSLGAAPRDVFDDVDHALRIEWAEHLIASWSGAGWWTLGERLGDRIADLVGAAAGSVVVTDTTTVNIYKALHAAVSLRPGRSRIMTERRGFPTDSYAAAGVAETLDGVDLELVDIDDAGFVDGLDESVAAVLVNHIDYRTARLRDMKRLTDAIHGVGAIAVWDLCHSVGVFPVELGACDVDFAVGCTYKFLNGGPGAPAFIHVAPEHLDMAVSPLRGWWGHADPFAMEETYRPSDGIRRYMVGTQPILSMRALVASLDMYQEVDLEAVRAKSKSLTSLFIDLVDQECAGHGLDVYSPRDADLRGSQVSLFNEHGAAIMAAMAAAGVHGGYREPGVMRFGFAPLYISHADVWEAVRRLRHVLDTDEWKRPEYGEGAIS